MTVAVVGSRSLAVSDLERYLPAGVTALVSGGAKGIDCCAKEYAHTHGLPFTEFLPEYDRFGRAAPLKRNQQIVNCADEVLAFWDGSSRGTAWVIDYCRKKGKKITVCRMQTVVDEAGTYAIDTDCETLSAVR